MLVKKGQAIRIAPSPLCTLWDFAVPSKRFGLAHSIINGRYPEQGKVLNTVCEKAYFAVSGKAIVHCELGNYEFQEGDAFYLAQGGWHWLEADNLHVVVVHSPPWSAEQHRMLP
jgi:mannose-6-phosphate isomerase-like protein (cupin superfamily)